MQAELRVLQIPDEIGESHCRCMHQLPIGIGKVANSSEIGSNFSGFTADFSATAPFQAPGGCPVTVLLPSTPVRYSFLSGPNVLLPMVCYGPSGIFRGLMHVSDAAS